MPRISFRFGGGREGGGNACKIRMLMFCAHVDILKNKKAGEKDEREEQV